jgi:diguanylate cyclase (GGDEF)-like protein/PAS domain S-box-containing protein
MSAAAAASMPATFRVAEDRRLERAINLARWSAGAVALGTGPAFPSLGWGFVIALSAGLFVYGAVMHVLTRPRPTAPRDWPYRLAFWLDIAVILFAMLVFVPDRIWSTFVFGLLVVVVNGFRRGGAGAFITATVIGAGYVAEAVYRAAAFGYPVEPSRLGTNLTAFLLAALLMSGIVRELRALRGLYEPLLAAEGDLGEGVVVIGADGRLVYWNDAVERLTGRDGASLLALRKAADLFVMTDRAAISRALADRSGSGKLETLVHRADGASTAVEVAFAPVSTAVGQRNILLVRDVSDARRTWQALRDEAVRDKLTGLPNRILFEDRLEQATAAGRRSGEAFAVLLIGVSELRELVDVYGRPAVDTLFGKLAERIGAELRAVDTLARIGDAEFAALLQSTPVADAEIVARKIVRALEQPFRLGEDMVEVGAAVGVAGWPEHADEAHELVRRAEIAMHAAGASASGYGVFSQIQEPDRRKLLLLPELRRAIEEDELVLEYQPEVSLIDGRVSRVEALVRWRRGDELILPDEFVPVAERRGLIGALTLWVIGAALRDRKAWSEAGWPIRVSVNASIRNLLDPAFPATIARLCGNAGVDPRALGIEVTESVLMVEPERTARSIADLRALGVHVAIDDFGTGYSSLAYLDRLPLDAVKIDKSFVAGVLGGNGSVAIVAATVDLGRHFGFELVAEGVEDQATLERLRAMGIHTGQGFHISRPLPADQVVPWLEARGAGLHVLHAARA